MTAAQKTATKPATTTDAAERPVHESLAAALAAFQAEVPTVRKGNTADAGNYKYQYADLSDVTEKALPLLGKHGLSFTARPSLVDGTFALFYELRHESGEADGGMYPLPDPSRTPAQQLGSAITYARRYTLTSVTGVAPGGDDDDAGAIQQHHYQQQRPPQQAQRPAQQQRPAPPAPEAPTQESVDWAAQAQALTAHADLAKLWQSARAAGAGVEVLDAIAARGRAAAQDGTESAPASDSPTDDADAAEAAAVAAHEAELAAAARASDEAARA